MALIQLNNVTFTYDGSYTPVFEHLSLHLDTDWKLGVIGRNGKGKTTLLNLLLGKYRFEGSISAPVSFSAFPFVVHDPSCTVLKIMEEMVPFCMQWQFERELSLLDVEESLLQRSFQTLSYGEQTKVLIAALFLKEDTFLLLDEPTNHLDMDAREKLGTYLNRKQGFLLVSHDRALLDHCTDHILAMNRETIEVQKGNFSSWKKNQENQDSFELAQHEKLRKEANRLETAQRRSANWAEKVEKTKRGTRNSGLRPDTGYLGHQSAKMMKRSKGIEARREEALEQTNTLLKNLETTEELKVVQLPYHTQRYASFEQVGVAYGERQIFSNITFTVERGERIALYGRNGTGKSTLLKLLLGELIPYSGKMILGKNLRISYVPQNAEFLSGTLDAFIKNRQVDGVLLRAILRKFDFSRTQFEQPLEEYSAGQKKKVLLAASLCEPAHLHVWDEPLNYIDILSRMQLEKLLLAYQPSIVFVEHDRAFCEAVATKFIQL